MSAWKGFIVKGAIHLEGMSAYGKYLLRKRSTHSGFLCRMVSIKTRCLLLRASVCLGEGLWAECASLHRGGVCLEKMGSACIR